MRKDFYEVYDEYFPQEQMAKPVETPVETFTPSSDNTQATETTIVDMETEIVPETIQEEVMDGNEPVD